MTVELLSTYVGGHSGYRVTGIDQTIRGWIEPLAAGFEQVFDINGRILAGDVFSSIPEALKNLEDRLLQLSGNSQTTTVD